jgi:hypothetical protein
MTILGKILVFVILVLSLLWTFLTASTFAARTNWQARSKQYQDEAQKAATAATSMKALLDSEREESDERVRVIREDRDRYEALAKTVRDERDGLLKQYNDLLASTQKQSAEVAPLIGQKEKLIAEVALKDDQIRQKDAELNRLVVTQNEAVVKANTEANVAKAQKERADRLAEEVQRLGEALTTARRGGGGRPGEPTEVRSPAPDRFRASVVNTARDGNELFVTINQGLDAGLLRNTELTLSRLNGQGKYLGKLVITSVDPKQAVGRFIRPAGRQLTPDDLPRAGDLVTGSN